MAKRDPKGKELDDDYDNDEDDDEEEGGWSFRRKFFTVIIVIIVIIAAVAAVFLLNPAVQQVLVLPPSQLEDKTGIRIEAQALLEGSGSANGEGTLKILYNGEEQYSSKVDFSGDQAIKTVKYNEFFYDRGEYEIIAKFKDKTSESYFFDPEDDFSFGIADYLDVQLSLEPDNFDMQNDPTKRSEPVKVNVLTYVKEKTSSGSTQNPRAPPTNSKIELTIEHEGGEYDTVEKTLTEDDRGTFVTDIDYSLSNGGQGAGYYTVSAKITNNYVKPTSPKYQVDLDDITTVYLNLNPIAVHDSSISESSNQDTVEVEFDASDSWNDGDILKYVWDFDMDEDQGVQLFEADEETTSPKVTHIYSRTSPLPTSTSTYTVGLMIIGDAEDPAFGVDSEGEPNKEHSTILDITVTITWTLKI